MTDNVIEKCNIRTATCVIHYDLTSTKKQFGKRLLCMAASYPTTKDRECLSIIIGTQRDTSSAWGVKELVSRSGGVFTRELEQICDVAYQVSDDVILLLAKYLVDCHGHSEKQATLFSRFWRGDH